MPAELVWSDSDRLGRVVWIAGLDIDLVFENSFLIYNLAIVIFVADL